MQREWARRELPKPNALEAGFRTVSERSAWQSNSIRMEDLSTIRDQRWSLTLDRKGKFAAGLAIILASTAFALSFQHTTTGRIDNFAFPSGSGPGFVQIQSLILKPGDSTGWHHHDGPSFVILERGNGVVETESCGGSTPLQAGTAFAEPPTNVH